MYFYLAQKTGGVIYRGKAGIVGPDGIYLQIWIKQSELDSMMVIVQTAHLPSHGVFYLLQKARAVLGDIHAKKASGPFCVPDL